MERTVSRYQIGEWTVEPKRGLLRRRDERIHLEPKAAELLNYLALRSGEVISRAELLDAIWPDVTVGDEVITNVIAKLRRALGDDSKSPELIETISKRGYRLVSTVDMGQVPRPDGDAPGKLNDEVKSGAFGRRAWLLAGIAIAVLFIATSLQRLWKVDDARLLAPTQTVSIKPTIAVLPFDNFSDDNSQEYFSDGLTEDLITDISKISGLSVIARHSTFSYKGKSPDVRDVGNSLGATHIVEGSVRREGDAIRISVQLVDASDGKHLWAERYDRNLKDVFAIQDEVVENIILALSLKLTPDEKRLLARRATENLIAYDLYLRGLKEESFYSKEANIESKRLFEEAVKHDPNFADAYAHLALAYSLARENRWSDNGLVDAGRALQMAKKAVELDDESPQAHWALGRVYAYAQPPLENLDPAMASLKRAVGLNPNYADGYAFYANVLNFTGRAEEALGVMEKAMRINPNFPFWYLYTLGQSQFFLTRFEASVQNLKKAIDRNPTVTWPHRLLASAYGHLGNIDDAEWELSELENLGQIETVERIRETSAFRDPTYLKLYLDGLRKAGVPESL